MKTIKYINKLIYNLLILLLLSAQTLLSQEGNHICGISKFFPLENMNIQRPTLPNSLESYYFKVHYSNQTLQSYASFIASTAEDALSKLQLKGWIIPPPDNNLGGNDKYDIYLTDTYHKYQTAGMTIADYTSNHYSSYPDSYSSFIEIIYDTLKINFPLNNISKKDFIKVIVSHELVHASQFAYSVKEEKAFYENSAVFVEKQIHPDIDLLPRYFNNYTYSPLKYPNLDINFFNNYGHQYTGSIWCIFLSEFYNNADIILNIWQNLATTAGNNYLNVLQNILTNFEDALKNYAIWRYFTGERHHDNSFSEGYKWPTSTVGRMHTSYPVIGSLPENLVAPEGLLNGPGGTYYICFKNGQGFFNIDFQGYQAVKYKVVVLKIKNVSPSIEVFDAYELTLNSNNYGTISLNWDSNTDSFVLVPIVVDSNKEIGFNYSAYLTPGISIKFENRLKNNNAGGKLLLNNNDTLNSGAVKTLQYNSINIIKPLSERFLLDSVYKHKNWLSIDSNYLLKLNFVADVDKTIFANFIGVKNVTIRNKIDEMCFDDSVSIYFNDPWYVKDANDNQSGIGDFLSFPSPYLPTGKYNQTTGGVFLNQTPDPNNPNKPYYSVGAISPQDTSLQHTGKTHRFYFQNWSANPPAVRSFKMQMHFKLVLYSSKKVQPFKPT